MGKPSLKAMALSCLCSALLTESDPSVRCVIAEALGNIGGSKATEALGGALQNDNSSRVREVIVKVLERIGRGRSGGGTQMSGDRIINITGGNYYESIITEGGNYIQGNYFSMSQDLAQAATQIQELLEELQNKGTTVEDAQEQVATGMTTQAQNDPKMRDKLIRWGQSLGDATISDVVKGVVKLAIRSAGIPLP